MPSEKIREGTYILLYLNPRKTFLVKVEKDKEFHTHKGFIKLGELIGKSFGTKVLSSTGIEFTVLKPTIRDYIFKSLRKTQIIYPKDIALIILFSGIGSGSRVMEAGTGTGALTCALAYYVKPRGHVYSYEVRAELIETAQKNIERAGLAKYVTIKNRDVTAGIEEKNVDAVVLDMATPWLVVPHAYEALKPSGSFVSFSPTIEQVIKTVEALKTNGFVGIETFECLLRGMQVERGRTRPHTLMTGHTGYLTFARKAFKNEMR